jgi:hypothetical protein
MGKKRRGKTVADDPNLAVKFDPDRNNGLRPEDVSVQNSKPFWWRCVNGGTVTWSATIAGFKKMGCPVCYQNGGWPGGGMSHNRDFDRLIY